MNKKETLCKAIAINEERLKQIPDFEIYHSIARQLNYLLTIIDGMEKDKSKLDKIILGHFAVREFEESDPELSHFLKKCQNVAFDLELES
ncbi:immunity protein Tsi6 family protein [Hahella sp. CR1]|uniref:immunity protein Tsi6 family protein n=1 Tax=Hahella sp. CR1 TaxID=2992807 RepID=UPI00244149BA|nr:immunity protein Tsi6 family protein [Hahella sp. CR1]MDG9670412.1 immunity protein Tsi6 family protein [Hahella sp. CR1]